MDCSLPGSSVHGIFQARILEWVAISFSRRSSWSRDWTCISWIGRHSLPLSHQRSAQKQYRNAKSRLSNAIFYNNRKQLEILHANRQSDTQPLGRSQQGVWQRLLVWIKSLSIDWWMDWICCFSFEPSLMVTEQEMTDLETPQAGPGACLELTNT